MKSQTQHKPTAAKFSLLRQLCNLIPNHLVPQLAREHAVEERSRTFRPWSHVVSLIYAQLTHSLGLNDVCDALRLHSGPRFLPPQVNAMLRAGEKLGDLKKVLPACREVLRIAPDTVRSTTHYMVAILLLFAPIAILMITLISTFVIPKFKDVFSGMGIQIWPLALFVFDLNRSHILVGFEMLVFFSLLAVAAIYIGGPGFVRRFQFRSVPIVDWIAWRIPWKQKKLQRAFSAMLAVLLDGGVPEAEAIRLAGEATANEICRRRARRVIAALAKGVKLDEAVRAFDDTGEFHWRLTNATHAYGGFLHALRGWHEALDAKAFQQEETATHIATSGLVILNGLVVALIAISMFGMLVMLLRHMVEL